MFQWFNEPKINFMAPRRFFLALSTLGCLAGVYACVLLWQGKANLGTDFGAGVLLRLSSEKNVPIDQVRQSLKTEGYPEAQIQEVTDEAAKGSKVIIKIKYDPSKAVGSLGDEVVGVFNKNFPDAHFALDGSDEVGPAVSQSLRDVAFWAFSFSMLGILIYIVIRFKRFEFGVAAVITTIHDILVILGIIVLTHHEFNLLQVTALLTLAGYSLNDTVVTFDRIRENMKLLVKDRTFLQMVNLSVNETLSRTINTSGTVFLTLLPLCIMGGDTLKDFALTLLLGVIVGTYSSIFVASPILVEWDLMSRPKPAQPQVVSK
ncbi:MAG TPA: protein translocase subunit SecF [bacterium]|nr:protein translocase subunit SecF [bacterium]